jgi:hypothetical protein
MNENVMSQLDAELANIVQYRKYNDLLKQATEQKVIVRMERNHLTFYGPAPF